MNLHHLRQRSKQVTPRSRMVGLTLIELMISMVIGLIIVGAIVSAFLSSNQTFKVNENLSKLQENARIGFELMARDIREAGVSPCGTLTNQMASTIRIGGSVPWWANWWTGGAPLRGFEASEDPANTDETAVSSSIVATGAGNSQRVAGTDSLVTLQAAEQTTSITAHNTTDKQFTLNSLTGFDEADVVVACDLRGAAIVQVGAVTASTKVVDFSTALASNNCTDLLGVPINLACSTTTPRTFTASEGALLAKLVSNYWYIGNNDRGGRSLFRVNMINRTVNTVKTWVADTQEIIPGVTNMQVQYLTADTGNANTLATSWVDANNGTSFPFPALGNPQIRQWDNQNANQVVAVKVQLTMQTDDAISTSNTPVTRTLSFVVGVRSRSFFNS